MSIVLLACRWNEKRRGECSESMSEEKITELDILTYNEATAERLTTIARLRRTVTSPAEATKDSLSSTCDDANRTVNQKPLAVEILLHFLSTRESLITLDACLHLLRNTTFKSLLAKQLQSHS